MALRLEDQPQCMAQERFGTRRANGVVGPNSSAMVAIDHLYFLRGQGPSYRELVNIMNSRHISCRKPGTKWHIKAVFNIIN